MLRVGFNGSDLALTCSADKTAAIWSSTGKRLQRIKHQSSIQTGAFNHQGNLVATGSTDRSVLVWRPDNGESALRLPHPGTVSTLAWSPDDRTLLTGCEDGRARLWDVATGRLLGKPQVHQGEIRRVAISSTGQWASGGVDIIVLLRNTPVAWSEPAEMIKKTIEQSSGLAIESRTHAVYTLESKPR